MSSLGEKKWVAPKGYEVDFEDNYEEPYKFGVFSKDTPSRTVVCQGQLLKFPNGMKPLCGVWYFVKVVRNDGTTHDVFIYPPSCTTGKAQLAHQLRSAKQAVKYNRMLADGLKQARGAAKTPSQKNRKAKKAGKTNAKAVSTKN